MKSPSRALALTAVAIVLAVGVAGCARQPSSAPLDVTYYYLPG